MRTLILTPWFPQPDEPIEGQFVALQTQALRSLGLRTDVMVFRPAGLPGMRWFGGRWRRSASTPSHWRFRDLIANRVRYVSWPLGLWYGGEGRRMAKALARALGQWDHPPVVVAHELAVAEAAVRLFHGEARVVGVVHGRCSDRLVRGTPRRRRNTSWVLSRLSAVVAVGPRLVPWLRDLGAPAERIHVLPNGFDESLVRATSAGPRPSDRDITVLSVSNLVPGKGVHLNILALASLRREGYRLRYRVVGQGRWARRLRALARSHGVGDAVDFVGPLPPPEVHREMAACDFFSLPSSPEAFGIVYVEAMAHGKPVVGCRGEGAEVACRHGVDGLLVSPGKVGEVVEAWKRLLDARVREEMGANARERAFAHFSWENNARRLLPLLDPERPFER